MSVKKLLVLAAGVAAISATAAMAGGVDHMAMPATQPAFQNSIYLDGHLGYAQSDWKSTDIFDVISKNGQGGFTGGLDMGYNFTRNIALEAGWFYLPEVTGTYAGSTSTDDTVKSWVLYTAAKLSAAVMDDLDIFGKVGVGYRSLAWSVEANNINGHYWLPLFAAGLEYTYGSWLFGAQYTYMPANADVNSNNGYNQAQSASLYTGFVGYKFSV